MPHPSATFYKGKRVLVTGHTGFHGGWLVAWLKLLGAQVCGYGLPPASRPNFFDATLLDRGITSIFGDVRDRTSLTNAFTEFQPEVVVHCAAQVNGQSADCEPVESFSTNVMGTVHVLEETRLTDSVRAVVIASCDQRPVPQVSSSSSREEIPPEPRDLRDASLAGGELASEAFHNRFFQKARKAAAVARTAEAIGGGDWGEHRLIPDMVRAITSGDPVPAGEDSSVCLWHVLESVRAYLLLGERLFECGHQYSGSWNFGPQNNPVTRSSVAKALMESLGMGATDPATDTRTQPKKPAPHCDTQRAQIELAWAQTLQVDQAITWASEWYSAFYADPASAWRTTEDQLRTYMRLMS